jgi:hypothetical protein
VISLSFAELLDAPETKAVLGSIKTHWGTHGAPAYAERSGPDNYGEEASVKELGREGACRQAALKVLGSIVSDAHEKGYGAIIKIRSFLDDQPALDESQYECDAGSKWASVEFLATLATLK